MHLSASLASASRRSGVELTVGIRSSFVFVATWGLTSVLARNLRRCRSCLGAEVGEHCSYAAVIVGRHREPEFDEEAVDVSFDGALTKV